MNRIAVFTIFLSILLTTVIAPAYSRDHNRGYGFLMMEEPVNPRNAAMGSVGTALGGAGFRYYNPVLPFFAKSPYVTAEFGQMPGGVNKGGFETATVFSEWFTAVSFHSSSVDFETRDERGFGAAASSSTTFGALATGYIRDNVAVGISANLAEDRIWVKSSYTALSLSAGIGYKLLDGRLNVGAAGFNGIAWSRGFGEDPSTWGNGQVPRFARSGAAWTDTLLSFPYTIAADVVYRDEDGTFTAPVGIDVQVLPALSVRMGKRLGWDNEILSLGVGLNIDRISFDAAFIPTVFVSDYEMKWSMAFTYNLGPRRKKPAQIDDSAYKGVSPSIDTNENETCKGDRPSVDANEEDIVVDNDVDTNDINTEEPEITVDEDANTAVDDIDTDDTSEITVNEDTDTVDDDASEQEEL